MGRILEIKVVPNSQVEEIIEEEPIIVKVRDPPEKGKANKAVSYTHLTLPTICSV